ncbi:aminotransferase-like domain-containing protein [Enterobacter huaxiensis]|uniref:aminotransferase-like domain-containing protein n=1 Tax=Enterobacter huaxiensis TaxID=2494702 RepID=UPI000E764C82|nr:PLP-dependent aminotransferase family protein [Enterobacter huaxiensis]UNC51790.1 PLP-dependent aminotransferase family protein [Enterobacter huaxiensis]
MRLGYHEIYSRYRDNITRGVLKPGDKVPAIRVLAEELKVARKTVETAYAILTGEGYLVSQGARGTRVNPDLLLPDKNPPAEQPTGTLPASLISQRERAGFLRPGIPSLDSFPYKKWLLLAGQATRSMRQEEMLNPPVLGWYPLREAIARYLNISRGLSCTPEQVLITSGYSGSLRLILDQHDRVIFMGTFSKTIMPSLRMGYIVMPASTVEAFTDCADIVASGQPVLTQKILTAFLNEGHFFRHLKKMRALYQTRRDWMIAALREVYGDLFFTEQNDGGMHVVAFLTKGSGDREIARCWQAEQLQVNALSEWYRGTSKRYGLVMGYNNVRTYQEAVDLLERPKRQTLALLS